MLSELKCLICSVPLAGKRTKFCCQKHALKWHNSQVPWAEYKHRCRQNARKRAAYAADPEMWRNKGRKWREDHPEQAKAIELTQKVKLWSNPWRKAVIAAKGRAKKKSIPFDLTMEWAEKRWTGFCELTGIPFVPRKEAACNLFSPSLDRIVSSLGYVQTNCRFILFGVNCLKNDSPDETMYFVAEQLLANRLKSCPQESISVESTL